jgi:hypothetical protein
MSNLPWIELKGMIMCRLWTFTLPFTLVLASSAASSVAMAQENSPALNACRPEAQRLCAGITPGGGRMVDCLGAQREQLSAACQSALPLMAQCRQEMAKLCDAHGDAKPMELARCVLAAEAQFSAACRAGLSSR